MSGTLPNVALSNNFDSNGSIMSGALLRIWDASTEEAVTAYKDSALTGGQEHPWPIVADAAGRIPMFWLANGTYRVRLTSSDGGYIAYDLSAVSTVSLTGASDDTGDEGDAAVVIKPGTLLPMHRTDDLDGYAVRANGRTIGSADSGGTERANADTADLFDVLWDDENLTVSGGRGVSSTADFAANKTIALPDYQGCVIGGLEGMGATRANRLTSTTFTDLAPTVLGALGGSQTEDLSVAQLPNVTPEFEGTAATLHYTKPNPKEAHDILSGASGTHYGFMLKDPDPLSGDVGEPTIDGTISYTPAGTIAPFGSGEAHNNVQPTRLCTIYIKL